MDKARIAEALSLLVETKTFTSTVREIVEVVERWNERPMMFAGKLEPYNALVDVGVQKREALDKLVALAASKRKLVPQARRLDYQRELMNERRMRLNKAVELEEIVRGKKMSAPEREQYRRDTQTKWMRERNNFIAAKGDLSWKQRNEAASLYWQSVDQQLEKDLAEARAVLERPPMHRKRVVQVAPEKPTALSQAFKKAKAGLPPKPVKKVALKKKR